MVPSSTRHASDSGSIVVGWLTRLVLTLAILGLVTFEVLSIVVAKVQLQDTGSTAAHAALDSYLANPNATLAYDTAATYATAHDAKIVKKSFVITADSVTFELKGTAPTLLLYRWSRTADLANIDTTVYAEPFEANGSSP